MLLVLKVDGYIPLLGNFHSHFENQHLTEVSCKSGIYQERGPKGPDF